MHFYHTLPNEAKKLPFTLFNKFYAAFASLFLNRLIQLLIYSLRTLVGVDYFQAARVTLAHGITRKKLVTLIQK